MSDGAQVNAGAIGVVGEAEHGAARQVRECPSPVRVSVLIQHYGWTDAHAGYLPGRIMVQQRKAKAWSPMPAGWAPGSQDAGAWVALSANASQGSAITHAVLPQPLAAAWPRPALPAPSFAK